MKRLAIGLVLLAGCGKADTAPTVVVAQPATSDTAQVALQAKVDALEKRLAKLEAKPISRPAAPAMPSEDFAAEATEIVGRLNNPDRGKLNAMLGWIESGNSDAMSRSALDLAGGRLDALAGETLRAEYAKSKSVGLQWSAKNLSARQLVRVARADPLIVGQLTALAEGKRLEPWQIEKLEAVLISHPALDKQIGARADKSLVAKLAEALKQSKEIERKSN